MSFTLAILSLRELVVEIDPFVPTCPGRLLLNSPIMALQIRKEQSF